jgi:glyoxylase-like metal-dependent hydrolase (beta-lactamase superfamily II)
MKKDDVIPLHVADVTYPATHPLAGQTGPIFAFLIRHPQGLILVDTGIGEGDAWVDDNYLPRARPIKDVIFGKREDADAVELVVNTHLHFDHAGQNSEFPDTTILIQDAEWEAAQLDDYTVRAWVDFPDANYVHITGDTEIAEGLRVLYTPGHTAGHQSVAVDTDDGLVLIAGQAAQDARAFATGPADASIQRLRDLNAAFIHFSHDRAVLKRTPAHGVPG